MKRSSLAWYVAVACLGGSLCVGAVVQADSPTAVKANPVVPTAMVTQVQSTQPTNSIVATNTPVIDPRIGDGLSYSESSKIPAFIDRVLRINSASLLKMIRNRYPLVDGD